MSAPDQVLSEPKDADGATIIELDGPERAFFDIPIRGESLQLANQGPNDIAFVERVMYHKFHIAGPTVVVLREAGEARMAMVRRALSAYGGGIIWWRVRPTLRPLGEGLSWYARLGTSPGLPREVWDGFRDAGGTSS
jgi:hypothetical protein